MSPTVSIIMPCYNAADHLPRSVGSVLAQTLEDWELIAVDDGSTDATPDVLKGFGDARIHPFKQANSGVSTARNRGLEEARGQYIAFLDADDTWAEDFLEHMVAALRSHPDAVLAYCGWQNVGLPGPQGEPFVPPEYERPDKLETLFTGCRWPIHAALSKREAMHSAGGFDTSLKNAEDYLLWLKVAGHAPIVRVPKVLAFYHFHGGLQATGNRARAALQHLDAQLDYLQWDPTFARKLGRGGIRRLVYGELLERAYEAYWQRDLDTARILFRRVMRAAFGRPRDWVYMLPALLPLSWYNALLAKRDGASRHARD